MINVHIFHTGNVRVDRAIPSRKNRSTGSVSVQPTPTAFWRPSITTRLFCRRS